MSFPEQVYQALGPLVADRCYPGQLPQDLATFPAIYWNYIGTAENTVNGESDEESVRLEINLVARRSDDLFVLRRPVSDAMHDTFDSTVRLTDMPVPYDESGGLFRRVLEFNVRA